MDILQPDVAAPSGGSTARRVPTPLLEFVTSSLGPCTIVSARSHQGRGAVVEAVDEDGTRWFAKSLEFRSHWRAEVRAYRRWVPALGDRAPRLHAVDGDLLALVMSAVPGQATDRHVPVLHRGAGDLLRRFHQARPARQVPERFVATLEQRLNGWLARSAGMFGDTEQQFVRDQLRRVSTLQDLSFVPCHGDYKPNNWLLDETGMVRIVDFADSRWHVPGRDVVRAVSRAVVGQAGACRGLLRRLRRGFLRRGPGVHPAVRSGGRGRLGGVGRPPLRPSRATARS